jgi:hypothetical protein
MKAAIAKLRKRKRKHNREIKRVKLIHQLKVNQMLSKDLADIVNTTLKNQNPLKIEKERLYL